MAPGSPSAAPTALVTGASRGIGKAIAVALAERGYDIAVTARTVHEGDPSAVAPEGGAILPGSLDTTAGLVEAQGRRCVPVPLDLLDRDALAPAVDAALGALGRLDVLVNNAIYVGPGNTQRFLENDPDDVVRRMWGNVTAQLLLTQSALRSMVASGGGTVVNIGSGAGVHQFRRPAGEGGPGLVYAMSKAGLHRMAPMLALEYGDAGIRAYTVDPGPVSTERILAAGAVLDFVAEHGVAPAVIGRVVAWLVADAGDAGEVANGDFVDAQQVARARGWLAR
jgi:NAD(P)-dependent dehydrogenase (short-subunit alcohol dehydrogenase family)